MNGVPTGLPSRSLKPPSVTMMSEPGKSAMPVLVRGLWNAGLATPAAHDPFTSSAGTPFTRHAFSDSGRPMACAKNA